LLLRQPINTGDGRSNEIVSDLIAPLLVLVTGGAAFLAYRSPAIFLRMAGIATFGWICAIGMYMAWLSAFLMAGERLAKKGARAVRLYLR
jgi:hypothetical protein